MKTHVSKTHVSKLLAVPLLLLVSLSHAVPAQAAGATLAALHAAAGQVYVSPGIARLIKVLLGLVG